MRLGKIATFTDIYNNIDNILTQLKNTILSLKFSTAKPLIYWLNDWSEIFLKNEDTFNPSSLIKYERGMVVQAHLGFKAKSEQGGLRYCLVVDNNNDMSSNIIMVIPLTSLDQAQSSSNIHNKYEIFLGYSIFTDEINNCQNKINYYKNQLLNTSQTPKQINDLNFGISLEQKILDSLKMGTVALVSQMCAMSKMRIYSPKYPNDRFYSFRLDDGKLDEIDSMIKKLYSKNIEKPSIKRKLKRINFKRRYRRM